MTTIQTLIKNLETSRDSFFVVNDPHLFRALNKTILETQQYVWREKMMLKAAMEFAINNPGKDLNQLLDSFLKTYTHEEV